MADELGFSESATAGPRGLRALVALAAIKWCEPPGEENPAARRASDVGGEERVACQNGPTRRRESVIRGSYLRHPSNRTAERKRRPGSAASVNSLQTLGSRRGKGAQGLR
jgi:hypothetical protein